MNLTNSVGQIDGPCWSWAAPADALMSHVIVRLVDGFSAFGTRMVRKHTGKRAKDRAPTWSWVFVDEFCFRNQAYEYSCKRGEGPFELEAHIVRQPEPHPFNNVEP
jgi:hypothetical protein